LLSLLLLPGFLIFTTPKHAEDMPQNRTKEVGEVLLNRKLRKMKLMNDNLGSSWETQATEGRNMEYLQLPLMPSPSFDDH
jgi:hypothetical protein